ncbi:hypothetical protein Barb6_01328 [Bacteroidales bacterium Barb6]|nr:hypothetical protein Barb6_01328 [Bacteroidales bacterium Barb6]
MPSFHSVWSNLFAPLFRFFARKVVLPRHFRYDTKIKVAINKFKEAQTYIKSAIFACVFGICRSSCGKKEEAQREASNPEDDTVPQELRPRLSPNATQMPRRGKRFQPHMQRSGMWGYGLW